MRKRDLISEKQQMFQQMKNQMQAKISPEMSSSKFFERRLAN